MHDALHGRLVRPGAADYGPVHELFDPRFDAIHPAGIAICASETDVQRAVAFARDHGVPFAARSGGHSYAGYSTGPGLVCDVGGLSSIDVDPKARTATIGAGAHLIDVYAAVAAKGVAVPGGSCATVGIAGLTLGGGQGVLGRKLGLTADSLVALRLVTAAGEVLTCNESEHPDLFWACRGGGGGNFGVVTSFTFRVYPLTHLTRFTLTFPWSAAADVVGAWQQWGPHAPDALWSSCHLQAAGTRRGVLIAGVYAGSQDALAPLHAAFRTRLGAAPRATHVRSAPFLDTMLAEAGCSGKSVAECHRPVQNPEGRLGRREHVSRSDFFDRPLSPAGIHALLSSLEDRGAHPELAKGAGGIAFDALGGAINRLAPDATAFVHRRSLFLAQYSTHWVPRSPKPIVDANLAWIDRFHGVMRPHASGFAYQNYIDPRLSDWKHAYYGANLARLVRIKAKHDPDDFFHFAQSIPVR